MARYLMIMMAIPAVLAAVHEDIRAVVPVKGAKPGKSWGDSYSVGNRCYCVTTFDHNIGFYPVETPVGWMSVEEACAMIGPGPGSGGRPRYNDVQCGNGPPNDATDEHTCPGRVDIGPEGCGHIGPKWNFDEFLPDTPAPVTPAPVPPAPVVTPAPIAPTPVTMAPVAGPIDGVGSIISFTLINADKDQVINGYLQDGDVLDISNLGTSAFTAEADVTGPVKSVVFEFDQASMLRQGSVFSLGGYSKGNYYEYGPMGNVGVHTIKATPFSERQAEGIQGNTASVTFTVRN